MRIFFFYFEQTMLTFISESELNCLSKEGVGYGKERLFHSTSEPAEGKEQE